MQVQAFLEQSAARYPSKTALVFEGQRLSYRWLEESSNRIAHGLIAAGVSRGDRVAVLLDNSVEVVLCIFAILKAGGVFVLVTPSTKMEKLTYLLKNSGARALFIKSRKLAMMKSCIDHTPELRTFITVGSADAADCPRGTVMEWNDLLALGPAYPPVTHSIDLDIAALIYTSGSTGNPKGVVMTHSNMVSAATSVIEYLENTADDVILNVLPLSFSYGLYQILMAFKVGATVVLERSFAYPQVTLQLLTEERVTGFAIVPTISAVLAQMGESEYRFSHLRYITNAGAALPSEHIGHLRRMFPDTKLFLMYGLTECKRVSYLPPEELDRRPLSVGKAMPNVEAYIVGEDGGRLGPGEVGELVVRGSNVMQGYWNLPEETEKVLRPGSVPGQRVLYTGDLFRMDEEGFLYWVGRRDDIIKSRGEKVSPIEVENVLCALDGVIMAAVVGVPDTLLGQAVKAYIAVRPGVRLTEKDILRHCTQHLEEFQIPKFVEFCDALPRTAAGKVDKMALRGVVNA